MKGIMFKEDLFNAILEGRKTQTRRVVKPQPEDTDDYHRQMVDGVMHWHFQGMLVSHLLKPRYNPGEVVYLKEPYFLAIDDRIWYKYNIHTKSGFDPAFNDWKNKMFMPESAARHFINISAVRVERLQDITTSSIWAEGVDNGKTNPKMGMRHDNMQRMVWQELWDSINKPPHQWYDKPFVWVYEFELKENS